METRLSDLREQRLQKLFSDCRQQVIAQVIGPFGLSTAMFEDRNGGNVTTLRNFKREDDSYVATDSDKALHAHSKKDYSVEIREGYEVDTKKKAVEADSTTWQEKRAAKIKVGKDEYTGRAVSEQGTITLKDGKIVRAELDHVVSIKEVHDDPKIHLSLGKTNKDSTGKITVDVSRVRATVNHDDNLALTNQPLNGSKSDNDLLDWGSEKRKDDSTNCDKFDADAKLLNEKHEKAKARIDETADQSLNRKQAEELLTTGTKQAALMAMRQALGLLLTELVNGLFNEIKVLIAHGIEAGKTLFDEIRERMDRIMSSVVKKIPDAVSLMFQGGISGFISNLLTFILNNFLSTAKRLVAVIREGLLGLFHAFKMIFFTPQHMTADQGLQEGLKILGTVIISTIGILLNESVSAFMATVPFLKPLADMITPVLIGIMSGLLSAFLAYQIDCLFDRYRHSLDEKFINELMEDAKRSDEFANNLTALSKSSISNVERYSKSISLYQDIGVAFGAAATAATGAFVSLEQATLTTREQAKKSVAMVAFMCESQAEIDDFLATF
ncbi:hypothetical protein BZG29_12920 [Janthinobacterium sp. LM6]|uniref:ECF transporter S component n=1 Tax=Janthinobacterium sp. LM6 TaxID=1938606 RepID=UPI000983C757|nr:ECF transporter S component [Janthinobacterium sp. LM6]AQR69140.1 hypothetical protein BZG29_12920 [Janthinobacterium sp. LM6]